MTINDMPFSFSHSLFIVDSLFLSLAVLSPRFLLSHHFLVLLLSLLEYTLNSLGPFGSLAPVTWTNNDFLRAKYNGKRARMNAPIARPRGSRKLKEWDV